MNQNTPTHETARAPRSWRSIVVMAGLVVLGVTPWASAQLPTPDLPAICPPLTAFAQPTLFNLIWGTTPIKFPYA